MIMAQDEGRFGRINDPHRCWAGKGTRPKVGKQVIREYVYVFTAVCPTLGKMSSLILPRTDIDMMNIFLRQVSEEYKDNFIIMQVDGAGWHRSNKLNIPENIRFVFQPAYSPELNPVELIWRELKSKDIANIVFDSLDELIEALITGLRRLINDCQGVKTLTSLSHLLL